MCSLEFLLSGIDLRALESQDDSKDTQSKKSFTLSRDEELQFLNSYPATVKNIEKQNDRIIELLEGQPTKFRVPRQALKYQPQGGDEDFDPNMDDDHFGDEKPNNRRR